MDYYENILHKNYGELSMAAEWHETKKAKPMDLQYKGTYYWQSPTRCRARIIHKGIVHQKMFRSEEAAIEWLAEKTIEFYPDKC